jgi:acetyl-CoA C-acetyltransferase
MKAQRYMHDFGITPRTLVKGAAKNYRNGSLNPNAFRRQALSEEEILGSAMVNDPLTQYMFCSPDEGAAAVVLCKAEIAHRYTQQPLFLRASVVRTRPGPPTRSRGWDRRTSTSCSCRTPTPPPR